MVLSSALPVVSMTFDEVGAPARLSGGPSAATNIPVVHTLLMAIQPTFDLEPKKPRKRYEKNGSDHSRPKIVQIGPVVRALERFCRMQSEREQTLVLSYILEIIGKRVSPRQLCGHNVGLIITIP